MQIVTDDYTVKYVLEEDTVYMSGTDTFTLNFPVRLRGVATHYCSRKQRLQTAHHWTRRRYPAKL
jgi:hypothetical protein